MSDTHIVSKFGGTSMGDLSAMHQSAKLCVERGSTMVVVSATAKTTDHLIQLAASASGALTDQCHSLLSMIKERHHGMITEITQDSQVLQQMQTLFTELDLLVQNITLLRELTPRAHDHILSLGERMSSLIFHQLLKSYLPGKKVVLLDARSVIKTDSHFGKATALIDEIQKQCAQLSADCIHVTQGFIGSDLEGNTTVLGRGGSDYSAALLAEALGAKRLEIWTDVPGIATTDPRLCSGARIIAELSYTEAAEMATYGAKILHPATITPAVRKSIPVFVGSTFDPHSSGTWIRQEVSHRPSVRAITKRSHQSLVTISIPHMVNNHGFMAKIFEVFARHRVSVDCVTTAETSVAISMDQVTLTNQELLQDLRGLGTVQVETGFALISLIGNNLFTHTTLARDIFSSVQETSIRMMSLGASAYNFNFLIQESESLNSINRLHGSLIEGAL
jgi:aspartate kinase